MAENQTKTSQKERLKEITDSIETGIKEMFESDKYKSYLQTMSRFHNYSLNNTMLIAMQKPDATLVAGYNKWKNSFSRNVKKGEKGIKIIAPVPYKVKEEREKLDPQTKAPMLDGNGKVIMEEIENVRPAFRVVSVFDVSQTEGKEIPSLASDLVGDVKHYEIFIEALKRTSQVPIEIKPITNGSDGYYHLEDKSISIREGMSEVQTISAIVHEIAHSKLHDYELQKMSEDTEPIKKDRNTEEVEAESISFAVCSYYGIETAENSLGYIANWSKNKELKELKSSLGLIGKTSSELITSIDKHFAEIIKERGIDLSNDVIINDYEILANKIDTFIKEYDPKNYNDSLNANETNIDEIMDILTTGRLSEIRDYLKEVNNEFSEQANDLLEDIATLEVEKYPKELAFQIDEMFLTIHERDEGYDYSIYDKEYNLLDGGIYDDTSLTIQETAHEVAGGQFLHFPLERTEGISKVDFTEVTEKADAVESAKIKEIKFEQQESNNIFDLSTLENVITRENSTDFLQSYLDTVVLKYDLSSTQISDFLIEGVVNNDFTIQDLIHIEKRDFAQAVALDNKSMIADKVIREHAKDTTIDGVNELIPLSKQQAVELWDNDMTIFALSPDNTESMIFDITEIEQHIGYFGIEKAEMEQLLKENPSFFDGIEQEKAFIDSKEDSFAIYQIKEGEEFRDYRFVSTKELDSMEKSILRENYNLVYSNELQNVSSINNALNSLYHDFNLDRPNDFTGHSLSVSDIIAINMNGVVSCHYVDSFGFKEVEQFLQDKSLEKSQDTTIEQKKLVPDDFMSGERMSTPRGSFAITTMTMEQMEASGYGVHHHSDDGKYAIMGNGTRAFAVGNPLKTAELSIEENANKIDGIINNEPKKSVIAELKATKSSEHKEKIINKKEKEER